MSRTFATILSMLMVALAENAMAAGTSADAIRGGWVTDIDGVRHVFILKVRDPVVSGIYCDVDCSDPSHLSLIERGSLAPDGGVRFQIRRLDGKSPARTDVVGRIAGNQLVITMKGEPQWTLQRDPRKPALVTVDEMFARRGLTSGPLVLGGTPSSYTPPGPNETLKPAAVEGLWLWGPGPNKQHFIFRQVDGGLLGVVCGPCDNPYSFGVLDNIAIHGETLTFDINHEDWGIGIEYGPFVNHATVTISRHEMHLHSVQQNGPRTIEGDMVLLGPVRP